MVRGCVRRLKRTAGNADDRKVPHSAARRFMVALVPVAILLAAGGQGSAGAQDDAPTRALPEDARYVIDTNDVPITAELRDDVAHLTDVAHLEAEILADLGVGPVAAAGAPGIRVSWGNTVPPADARVAIESAVATWDAALVTNNGVDVRVYWHAFNNNGLLGFAGPNGMVDNQLLADFGHPTVLPTASNYPIATVNQLLGYDANGSSLPEVEVHLNADLYGSTWYTGSGNPGFGELDLETVMLHEVGHGLGFLGSAENGSITTAEVFVFDEHVHHGTSPLLSQPNPSSHLTQGNLFFDVGGGTRYEVYAPGLWQEGSSYSHLDESAYPAGSSGALMTPTLSTGETGRIIDLPTLQIMEDMAWELKAPTTPPQFTSLTATGETVNVSWTLNTATAPSLYRVEAYEGGDLVGLRSTTANSTSFVRLETDASHEIRITPYFGSAPGGTASQSITTPGQPNRPDIVGATGDGDSIVVSWSTPNAGASAITGYRVERSTGVGDWAFVGTTSNTQMSVNGLGDGVWQFRVRASNAVGDGAWGQSQPLGFADLVRPVPLDGEIARLYNAYLQRDPDPGGLDYWRGQRIGGAPAATISNSFAGSAEFADTYGPLTNTQFVELVYQNVLNRAPDSGGLAYWVGQLDNGVSRGAVMSGFAESDEFVGQTGTVQAGGPNEGATTRLYLAFFKRLPDAGGLAFWSGQLDGGNTVNNVAAGFAGSAEFDAAYGSLTDGDFVVLVYNNVLDRGPDAGGLAYWSGQLAGGLDRGVLVGQFAESDEFVSKTGTLP